MLVTHIIFEAFALCKNGSVFRNEILTSENKILGRFSFSCCCINIFYNIYIILSVMYHILCTLCL